MLPVLSVGGVSSLARALCNELEELENKTLLISLYSLTSPAVGARELNLKTLSSVRRKNMLLKILMNLLRVFKLILLIRKNDVNKFICLDPTSSLLALICCRLYGRSRKISVTGSCHTPLQLLEVSDKFIIRFLFSKLDSIAVPSETLKQQLLQLNSSLEITIIPNSFSDKALSCKIASIVERTERANVLFLGRLEKEKNARFILDLADKTPSINFLIVGDGSEKNDLIIRANERNLKNVQFLGRLDPSECLPCADLLILPSIVEAFGIVIIEAWLHGVPVLSHSGALGAHELIKRYGGGRTVSQNFDLEEWLQGIREGLAMKLDSNFPTFILESFNSTRIVNEWLSLSTTSRL